jgi:hypothetical protein
MTSVFTGLLERLEQLDPELHGGILPNDFGGAHRIVAEGVAMRRGDAPEVEIATMPGLADAPIELSEETDRKKPRHLSDGPETPATPQLETSEPDSTSAAYHGSLPNWIRPTREDEGDTFVSSQSFGPNSPTDDEHHETPYAVQVAPVEARLHRPSSGKRAYGGGELGQLGVTPAELKARSVPSSHHATRRLIDAISDYVDERLAKHVGEVMRQGIIPH